VLDWYINPDHAPIMVAEQIGAFKAQGLDVKIVPPSDPALPPRLVAAGQADLAITYQPQVHFFADEGLPLVRVGTLINSPLNTVIALDKRIKTPADLKGKKVGYSVSGIEQATLATMAQHAHIDPQSIKLINVNFQLTSALLAGQVDAVIGGYRNIEALELKLQGKDPQVMNVEDFGVPAYDELVIVANAMKFMRPKSKSSSSRCRRSRLSARASAGNLAGVCRRSSGAEYRTEPAGLAADGPLFAARGAG
jgi:putative hydroxymethylpyrimidine transport system substrate-binding protein